MVTRLDAAQVSRNARGLAACRAVLAPVLARLARPTTGRALTLAEQIRQRALERAHAEKRDRQKPAIRTDRR